MIFQVTVYVLLTLCTEILTAVIAEPGRHKVPGYTAVFPALVFTAPTTLLEDSLQGSLALDLFQLPVYKVTR